MRFERESWRKLYVAESMQHRKLSLITRGVRDYLLRVAEEDGTLFVETDDPAGDLAAALNAQPSDRKALERAVADLLRIGYLSHEGGRLWITKFELAQAARSPGAKRQAKYVAKKKNASGDDSQPSPDTGEASPGDVSSDAQSVTSDVSADVTKDYDETRRDETTTTKPPAVVGAVACPRDLRLTSEQRSTLETSLIPGWAIDVITRDFVANYQADPDDKRELTVWRKCLSKAVSGTWNNAARRPKKPESGADVYQLDAQGNLVQ